MDQREQDEFKAILAEAQEIVDQGLGGALSGSVARDSILVNLSGVLLQDHWDRKHREGSQSREQMLIEQIGGIVREALTRWQKDSHSGRIDPQETAMALTKEMAAQWPERAREREWVWDTFAYFLEHAQRQLKGKAAPPEPA